MYFWKHGVEGYIFMTIQTIIEKLGYNNSANLYYYKDIALNNNLPFHTIKVLREIKPFATYCIDEKPFVLFFDNVSDSNKIEQLSKKIWNSQIPVIIISNESTVKIYNGSYLNKDKLLIELVEQYKIDDCNEYSSFSYWNVTDQNFWIKYEGKYSHQKLSESLLENIEWMRNLLKEFGVKSPTKLILRLIFIRFLIDRGIDIGYANFTNNIKKSQEELLNIVKDKNSLYLLFAHLKEKLNGNLFDLKDDENEEYLTQDVLQLLYDFLSGQLKIKYGQLSLFSMYDFNIIPVELISNIYEILLGKETQENDKAFYTPIYLVDYILKESVIPYLYKNKTCKILDPACGSGVFLVESFRNIVESNLEGQNYFTDDEKLKKLLVDNIFGVDKNSEAIDVTIFSLYLTILDYKDPKTLIDFKLPNLLGENLVACNFFDDIKISKLKSIKFDFIIGNPPWGRVKDQKHADYCKANDILKKNNEISRSFTYRVNEFCTENTVCCLVLPSRLLYTRKSPAPEFRHLLLSTTKIEKILELSSVRKSVFKNADAPAIIMIFRRDNSDYLNNKITHISFKPNIFFKLFNVIVTERNDVKYIPQSLLLKNDWAWKTILFCTSWDFEIIKNIKNKYPTIEKVLQRNNIIYGTGIQDHLGDGKDATHLNGKILLDSDDGIDHFSIFIDKNKLFNKNRIHRPREPKLFEPPY